MKTRETIIRRWFDMWLQKKDLGIAEMFSDNATYIESWGPEYHGSAKIKLCLTNGIPVALCFNGI